MTKDEVFETLVSELKRGLAEITADLALLRARLTANSFGSDKFIELCEPLRTEERHKLLMLERLYHDIPSDGTIWDKIRK
jgi:hypothetical protein